MPARLTALVVLASLLSACVGPDSRRAFHFAGYRVFHKAPAADCWKTDAYRACVYRSRAGGVDEGTLVWFFHYAQGDERSFSSIGLAHEFFARLAELGAPAPRVVSVSFGSHWLLSGEEGRRQVLLVDDFAGRVLPEVEARLGAPRRRLAWGMSMGGWNAAELSLRRPALFSKVALSCPALLDADPFEGSFSFAPRRGEGRDLWRHRLTGSSQWRADDPAALAAASGGAGAAYLLQPNARDEFGFQGGAAALAKALGPRAETAMAPDGHCFVDARRVADFLARPR